MDRNESANEGGSSPDTVIGRSSSEEDRNRQGCTTSGEYVTVGDSSSSLDTLNSAGTAAAPPGTEDKKRGRFGALKNSFRKEGGLFKIKKKNKNADEACAERETDVDDKETAGKRIQEAEDEGKASTLKKKKKSSSLVRKLSLNKFRLSSDQERRQTQEGGDSSRSQSQSSQESPSLSDSPSRITRKGQETEVISGKERLEERSEAGTRDEKEREREKGETWKSEKLLEKPVSTVTVVQRRSPSLTIRSFSKIQHDPKAPEKSPLAEERRSSTLPYTISKWPEPKAAKQPEPARKSKLNAKSESESGIRAKSSPHEVRRKLSLLEEKRAIFQRRLFETTQDSDSSETVIAVSLDDEDGRTPKDEEKREAQTKKKARHISVKKFDTFSTFEGTFDEETGVGYLAGIEEDYTESYDRQNHEYPAHPATMGPMVGATGETAEKSKVVSQDSTSSQNNAPNAGLGEKREHLYKILVIGELGAGKTSIIKRYVHQFFSQHYRATIGVDFALKVLNWDPHTIIRLQLWDIAGQERFGNMTRVYYKEAVGAFIVFDVTRSATLDAVVKWKQDLDSKVQLPDGSPIPCVLLANKCDQQKEGLVNSATKMDDYCKEKNFAGWFETSAKENINIEEAARFLVNKILQNDQLMKGNGSQDQTDGERFALNQSPTSSKKSCSC
ncbi:EF-hand calcium-binding domain-containing protein 4B isoform X1 [Hylaeus anthracinus]|uniref:EF-hand calcium-binding domain-containing protein 4B isoform X1 n=1 Tax=Hylaeus anthracinus TaxID=313031 RepID=UPI0023B928D4|nr:EF-hand calcium-binding domain-containing protein 4B isoform X1 [Hylaeus anthracinus]XP_053999056.1 EF-hand calcium-binding domain-containing protein 4B isoform X1 [Hylaeus anthracinus]XP_053999067.1 EF-hand calcium-binding domain-containing protein 4B isoform X1 [Hylaeus anthracinus]